MIFSSLGKGKHILTLEELEEAQDEDFEVKVSFSS